MTNKVTYIRFGPRCTDREAFDVVVTRSIREFGFLASNGALIIDGHPLEGFEHVINDVRSTLPEGHSVVAIRPCPRTAWFWRGAGWRLVEQVVPDIERIVEGCVEREPMTLLKALLGPSPQPSHTVATPTLIVSGSARQPDA